MMQSKKRLGIIGGMGSNAGVSFFKKVIACCPASCDQDFIEIVVHSNSKVPDRTRAISFGETSPVDEIVRSIKLMEQHVDVIAIPCVTSFYFYPEFSSATHVPILHPVSLVKEELKRNFDSKTKIGLLATTGTIQSRLFTKKYDTESFEFTTLNAHDQEEFFMRSVYMKNGLKSAVVSNEARKYFDVAVSKLLDAGAEVIVGACTEVQLALDQSRLAIPYVDAVDLLAKSAVEACYDPHYTFENKLSHNK
ncbi:MAG: hypothetical protein DI538_18800 [Azospira oryzae]|nr:MAG: hypothetical protein DI538_18800 [Azospira oryzae]